MGIFKWFFSLFHRKHKWSSGMKDYIEFESWKADKRSFYGEDR